MLDKIIVDVCKNCKSAEVVKRDGQLPKLKCDVLKTSVFIDGCIEGLDEMEITECLKCKCSSVQRRTNGKVKLECIVVRGILPLEECISEYINKKIAPTVIYRATVKSDTTTSTADVIKRKRGRPAGAKNKKQNKNTMSVPVMGEVIA